MPFFPAEWICGWLAAWLAVCIFEQLVARRRGYISADIPGALVSFGLSALQATAAAALIQYGDGGARFFAVVLIGFSSVNILLRYYAAPRLLLATMAPHGVVLALVCSGIFMGAVEHGQMARALTAIGTLLLYVFLIWPIRNRLMEAWLKLLRAKAQALEERRTSEAASRAKSEFLNTMSHEIRTPLNGILGMAQALQREELSTKQIAGVRVIRSCGQTLLAILNDVLDLSQIETGRMAIERKPFDMEHATRGAVATFGPLAAKKGLAFDFAIAEDAKGTFDGDPVRLRQILHNLVSNAVKFTERGAVGVTVGSVGGQITLEVADSGVGIPAEKLDAIFDKFVQADGSTTRTVDGAGLGLAICRELVVMMGGSIAVDSAPGRGSVFTVTLPLERIAEARGLEPQAPQGPAREEAPVRVLAAEDNPVNRLVLTTLLSQAGVALTVVENGEEAVNAWRAEPWDVILMDVRMPVMDGVAATRAIRHEEVAAGRPRTPIVAVTANAMPEQCAEYLAVGMDEVIAKPIEIGRLFSVIEAALEDTRARAA